MKTNITPKLKQFLMKLFTDEKQKGKEKNNALQVGGKKNIPYRFFALNESAR